MDEDLNASAPSVPQNSKPVDMNAIHNPTFRLTLNYLGNTLEDQAKTSTTYCVDVQFGLYRSKMFQHGFSLTYPPASFRSMKPFCFAYMSDQTEACSGFMLHWSSNNHVMHLHQFSTHPLSQRPYSTVILCCYTTISSKDPRQNSIVWSRKDNANDQTNDKVKLQLFEDLGIKQLKTYHRYITINN